MLTDMRLVACCFEADRNVSAPRIPRILFEPDETLEILSWSI